MTLMYADVMFAPLDADLHLERVAGGNETEVYCTDDKRFVVKVKSEENGNGLEAPAETKLYQTAAAAFTEALGPKHTIPNYYLITQNSAGQAQTVVVQPYLRRAQQLSEVDYRALSPEERSRVARQLRDLIRRARNFYAQTGHMPDLYGRTSRSKAERKRLNTPVMLPWRLWSFIVKRNILRSHNLMLTEGAERRVILVDYDPIRKGRLYRFVYYSIRQLLFLRDYWLISMMEKSGYTPKV